MSEFSSGVTNLENHVHGCVLHVYHLGRAMGESMTLLCHVNIKCADQPALPQSDQRFCYSLTGKYINRTQVESQHFPASLHS